MQKQITSYITRTGTSKVYATSNASNATSTANAIEKETSISIPQSTPHNKPKIKPETKTKPTSTSLCISECVKKALETRVKTYVWFENRDGTYYTCQIKDNYVYRGNIIGDMKYTEIIKKNGFWTLYKYYPKILTYSNECTYEQVIYTQEYDHPKHIELWFA